MHAPQPHRHTVKQWIEPRVRRVVAAIASCEACGEVAFARLCPECRDQARPHVSNDPYDVVGGEGGGCA
jgi:recombinational DNA repair protein RecR